LTSQTKLKQNIRHSGYAEGGGHTLSSFCWTFREESAAV
jgi:hypothetical protein